MKALLCENFGLPETLNMAEVDKPSPNENQILIKVKACGINFPDSLIIQDKYQFKPRLPFAPGGEVSGVVDAVGKNVSHVKPGDKVFALTIWGGLAEYALADSHKCLLMPENMDFITAATTMYTCGTSLHALKQRAQIKPGETLLVLGAAGGVGLAAVQIGKLIGAKVIAAASTDEKLEVCQKLGADDTINYTKSDLRTAIKELTNEKGVDVVYDPIGDKYSEPAVRSLAWQGRYLVVGFAAGVPSAIKLNLPLLKGASIVGVFWGAFAQKQPKESMQNFKQILGWIDEKKLQQNIHQVYSLKDGGQAIRDLMNRKVIGKNVVKIN
ncbi:NADPH:quinone oxidoreductase family protein [Roseivirga misakiensis]|uniref:NADPH:quinone oxidoreductase n=1 Tax=Roseivirga misakiensis TaxID=1563681 RepID=A0A1E5SZR5_9BACT|nr:NADPH:quinone oxidoreductase family protein [Roseivirga misakiensis]OEK04537.1 NADPH:quinone oxidoreductase [Roseivirga misakiensis]